MFHYINRSIVSYLLLSLMINSFYVSRLVGSFMSDVFVGLVGMVGLGKLFA